MFKVLGQVKEISLQMLNGDSATLPVRWFYVGDYKSEKAVFGIKDGKPTYPSINCLSTMKETYSEVDLTKSCPPRPSGCHFKYSQQRESLAPFIPPSQFIPPPLHLTLGPGAALFDYLFETVAKIDSEKGNAYEIYKEMTVNENWKKQIRSAYEEITTLQKELNEIQEVADLYAKLFSSTKVISKYPI
uniref:Uncharacterized protein n=1 Tax=Panagrolaimus sp. PS1159 TaxID=55785 RepID=A0AC35GHT4_9BILA